ncbi:hypothetical protein Afil01_47700 [Actinorhabdospora filicis]|uniref:Uncharacterized protein n=1 Tax=Actinorhabdospora filicis TaxID=1785913 RepID=A0A9W6SPX4_9ACTN|nr:hypothetical protein [Actinorhabdospora filicis]GLZ79963.1 hypothetical protein Afil01_47700 [Actinorhabdospora filicis]
MNRRWFLLGGGAVAAGVAAFALWPSGGPRPITIDEAGRLALSRYTAFTASPLRVRVEAPMAEGTVVVDGVIDYRSHHAVGEYRAPLGSGLIAWDAEGLRVAPGRGGGLPESVASTPDWSPRAYTDDPLDTALRLSVLLGQDRPDNAQVLAGQEARWLRREAVGGRECDVFSGPRPRTGRRGGESPLAYWVDADGRMRRATMRLPDGGTLTVGLDETASWSPPDTPWA